LVRRPRIVNQTLTRIADHCRKRSRNMQRLRLKADGRIVELRDGREFPLAPAMTFAAPAEAGRATPPAVRELRRRARLTQIEFASRLGVPVETIRNWEQGKRMPRGPARALLAVIAHAPDMVFAALAPGT
jgi:putative transcriptional regulator